MKEHISWYLDLPIFTMPWRKHEMALLLNSSTEYGACDLRMSSGLL